MAIFATPKIPSHSSKCLKRLWRPCLTFPSQKNANIFICTANQVSMPKPGTKISHHLSLCHGPLWSFISALNGYVPIRKSCLKSQKFHHPLFAQPQRRQQQLDTTTRLDTRSHPPLPLNHPTMPLPCPNSTQSCPNSVQPHSSVRRRPKPPNHAQPPCSRFPTRSNDRVRPSHP